jgi:signal peptidase I
MPVALPAGSIVECVRDPLWRGVRKLHRRLSVRSGSPNMPFIKSIVVAAFAIAGCVSAALAQTGTYKIPSGSMKPTLMPGDVVNVAKYPAGTQPARGDLIAFRLPSDTKTVFIMRVVGLAGDKVQVVGGALQINGEAVKREQIADFADTLDGKPHPVKRWRETLTGSLAHETIDLVPNGPLDNTAAVTVPAGHVFVLGDNRDNARDSRDPSIGTIPLDHVNGRVSK